MEKRRIQVKAEISGGTEILLGPLRLCLTVELELAVRGVHRTLPS
jgi:hypothetical protein